MNLDAFIDDPLVRSGLVALLVFGLLPIGAMMRNPLVVTVAAFGQLLATPFVALGRLAASLKAPLDESWEAAKLGSYQGERLAGGPSREWAGWAVGAFVIDVLFLLILASADWAIASLALAGLIGATTSPTLFGIPAPEALATLGGLLFVVACGFFVAILFEMLVKLPVDHPWQRLTGRWRGAFMIGVCLLLVMTIVAAISFAVWRETRLLANAGLAPAGDLTLWSSTFWILFGVIVVVSSGLATAAVMYSARGFILLLLLAARGLALLARVIAHILCLVLDAIVIVFAALVDVLIWPGLQLWNWLAGFGWAHTAHLSPVAVTRPASTGARIDEPFGWAPGSLAVEPAALPPQAGAGVPAGTARPEASPAGS